MTPKVYVVNDAEFSPSVLRFEALDSRFLSPYFATVFGAVKKADKQVFLRG